MTSCCDEDGGMDGYWLNMSTQATFTIHLASLYSPFLELALSTHEPYLSLEAFFSALRT